MRCCWNLCSNLTSRVCIVQDCVNARVPVSSLQIPEQMLRAMQTIPLSAETAGSGAHNALSAEVSLRVWPTHRQQQRDQARTQLQADSHGGTVCADAFSAAALSELAILQQLQFAQQQADNNNGQSAVYCPHFPLPMTVVAVDKPLQTHSGSGTHTSADDEDADQDGDTLESVMLSRSHSRDREVDDSDSDGEMKGARASGSDLRMDVDRLFADISSSNSASSANVPLKHYIVSPQLLMPLKLFMRTIARCKKPFQR
jgi:hypothetical protein